METVRQAYPVDFRQTNGFIEIGLFLFTTLAILGSYLLVSTFFSTAFSEPRVYGLFNISFGVAVGLVGQRLINARQLYRNGVDNAFVVMLAGFLAFGLNQLLPERLSVARHCLFTLPLLLVILWYYGDTLIAFLTLATFYAFVFDGLLQFGWGKDALPFVLMAVSVLLYGIVRRINQNAADLSYYADPLNLAQWLALIVLAASGNYFVVRTLNGLLIKPIPVDAPPINLPALFWLLTFLIPVLYVWQGFAKTNRMLIILGELGLIAAVMTVYEYTALVPLNVALTLGGLLMIGLAIVGIRYLREPKNGYTDAPDEDSPDEFFLDTQAWVAAQAAAGTGPTPKDDVRFGGGNFGGGGSEGPY